VRVQEGFDGGADRCYLGRVGGGLDGGG